MLRSRSAGNENPQNAAQANRLIGTASGVSGPPNTDPVNSIMLANPGPTQSQPYRTADFPGLISLRPSLSPHTQEALLSGHSIRRRSTETWSLDNSYSAQYSTQFSNIPSRRFSGANLGFVKAREIIQQRTRGSAADANGRHFVVPEHRQESTYSSNKDEHAAAPPSQARQAQNESESYLVPKLNTNTSASTVSPHPMATNPTAMSLRRSPSHTNPYATRCSLHIRQQPRAARAGPDGKDRRPVDPPPVLQLMIEDFNPSSEADVAEMHAPFVVHCNLVSVSSPRREMTTKTAINEDGSREVQRLLLGNYVSSPFHTKDDPDPPNMPQHPTFTEQSRRSPSPSSRFLSQSHSSPGVRTHNTNIPGAFFIFADLSVRKAGEYRLEFALMKMDPAYLMTGTELPILNKVTSDVFRVVNAKDFDQVHPSTALVKGLLDRGAGYPLKLKKGTREGGRRKNRDDQDDSDDDDMEPDDGD